MLYEYALEPALLSNWKDFRYFTEKFGFSQRRLISCYPKHWKRMVYESLTSCGEIERKRIEDRLQKLDDRILKRQHEWDRQCDWLTNAEAEHARRPFYAILARSNPNNRDYVLEEENISEDHPFPASPKSPVIRRVAGEMAACVALLLRAAEKILFIDPYFGPQYLRYQRPLEAFLDAILEQRQGEPPTRIEIHASDRLEAGFFKSECDRHLPKIIPEGISVRLVQWRQKEGGEKLHNRFILTDKGGVRFGVGLDDSDGADGETDEVESLGEETYKFRWAQYASSDPAFDFVDKVDIEGQKPLHGKKVS